MRWILKKDKDIFVDSNKLEARREYIQLVTGAKVTDWDILRVNGQVFEEFLCCISNEGLEGTFITAHIGDVTKLCTLRGICTGKFVVANTCIWEKHWDKKILFYMMFFNPGIELYFAKQELWVDGNKTLRQTTTICNHGEFGFKTSKSERQMLIKSDKGLMKAIKESFDRVSPVILPGD